MGVLITSLAFKHSYQASNAGDEIYFDIDVIEALSHQGGEVVDFVNSDIVQYWDSDASDYETLKTLYEMNSEIASFPSNAFDHDYTRYLYAKWDDFKPVNNTLTWRSNVKANSYDVVVSLNAELTEAIYEEKGLLETSYTMVNPFSNTHYFWQVTAHTDNGDIKSSIFDFYSGDYKRTVDIPTISNTRDIGGFTGKYGTMKQGLIYRSGRLDDVNNECQEALAALDIQTDLDLRSNGEGQKNPAKLPNYYLRTLLSYFNDVKEENRAQTIEAVRIFADPNNYPVIFHCAVGRDRTGTLAMILQALAGASKEYIIHDYYMSMWSVTGAYQKTLKDLNLSIVMQTLDALESYGDSLSSGAENFLRQREDENTHELVGLTDSEIQAIRDIWSGKTSAVHGPKTFKASDNYEGKAFVKIKAIGHKDICMMVNKGSKIEAPYQLESGLSWYSNGDMFDFSSVINGTTFIYADYSSQYIVIIHFVGIAKQDEILRLNNGETILINDYVLDGYEMLAISDEGKEISKITIFRDTYINIIYSKK